MKFLPVGTVVELQDGYSAIYLAATGARGVVEGCVQEDGFNYYQIIWDEEDPKVNGQMDGLVDCHHVRAAKNIEKTTGSKQFSRSKYLASKAILQDGVSSFLLVFIKNGVPYTITDAATSLDALKIVPDALAVATQLAEVSIHGSIEAHETIEKIRRAADLLDLDNDEDS
jgi:hypothetical protein